MVTQSRWETAQAYERNYWHKQAQEIAEGTSSQLDWYRWRADQLAERLRRDGLDRLTDGSARVVEVGSGPIGVATYFKARDRVAVDPLEDFYAQDPVLTELRDPSMSYRQGMGESLPCETAKFDLAMIENCIDHTRDMDAVMREIHRVLVPGGILYLTVNNRTRWGFLMHRLISRLRVDAGHPHTMTPARTRALVERNGFEILEFEVGSYEEARAEDLASDSRKARLKGRLGVSEYLVSLVARRTG